MPSKSQAQQKAMGMALAAKRGDIPKAKLGPAAKAMSKMDKSSLEDFASTPRKGLPSHVKKGR